MARYQGWLLACVFGLVLTRPAQAAIWTNAASLRMIAILSPLLRAPSGTPLTNPTVCGNIEIPSSAAADVTELLSRAERVGGRNLTAIRHLVEVHCSAGDYVTAEAEASRFEQEHGRSHDPVFVLARGWNSARAGNLVPAAAQWREVPAIRGLLLDWAQFDLFSARPLAARVLADYALAIDETCQRAAFLKAGAMDGAGDLRAALRLYQGVAADVAVPAPDCSVPPGDFALTYGRALHRAGLDDEALDWLDRAHRLSPADPRPLVLLAEARWLGHLDATRAEAAYREAIRIAPNHVWSYLGLASLFLTLHAPEKALPWIELAERYAGPGERERPAVLRGQALLELGRYADALAVLRQAQEVGPQNGWSAYFMGEVFEAQGDTSAALAAYQRAAQLLPDDRGVRAALTKATARQAAPRSPH